VTAAEEGIDPHIDPCMGAVQLWALSSTFANPRGHDSVALWERRSPPDALQSTPESHAPLGTDLEAGQETGLGPQ
jgi:hypothetical protein